MLKNDLLSLIDRSNYYQNKLKAIRKHEKTAFSGVPDPAKSALLAILSKSYPNIFVITSTSQGAEAIKREIEIFVDMEVNVFPALDVEPDEDALPSKDLVGHRLMILDEWAQNKPMVVVAPLKAALIKTIARSDRKNKLILLKGGKIDLEETFARLVKIGYKRREIVGEPGEFSLRGGVFDVFPPQLEYPVRVELLDDKIESLRYFDPYSQRSIQKIEKASLLPIIEERETSVLDHLPENTLVVVDEMIALTMQYEKIGAKGYLDLSEISRQSQVELSNFLTGDEDAIFSSAASFVGDLENIPKTAIVLSRHHARLKEEFPEIKVMPGWLRGGFKVGEIDVLSDRELFGEENIARKKEKKVKEGVAEDLLADLKIGDYVVHENYGIGIYGGIERMELDGVEQEYLLIEYAENDKLYVPPHMAGLVEKYSGGGASHPKLSKLSSKEWLNTRSRVKQALKDLTKELLVLYAAREKFEGFAYPPDDIWQKEMEATFPYEETVDQLKAIAAVKKDMESGKPMDRLVCGDVGYGKTEVAIRAAAKAAAAGKQVAILAPTTILVEQHYNNFKERFKNLPYAVDMLSRFRSKKDQKDTVKLLEAGGVDIIIGTHRLLSKDIKFRDLGLLIIDEEQKFGVSSKEKIKQYKKNVDVLTLTATPIPRTLYFSLSGIREFSLIATPPIDRSPVRTYVVPYSEKTTREAILREIDRGGQVYFVHNFVESIKKTAASIARLVPEAKIAVGHGQMNEKELEKTMLDFMDKKYDVLVCTSIIESGLDITNVNTIIIDQADRFGLSQLYQIRGRVGRSTSRAYAYLFYHPERGIAGQAMERLKAIQEFTALGSGYKLAMRDLEIRGAGNLLGAQQSGHIYEVGFDLYVELLEEAVREAKGEVITPLRDVEVDLSIEASIPPSYVTDERQRIALYRRMNIITTREGINDIKKELLDRFGKIPKQVEVLLQLIDLKVEAVKAGIKSIREERGKVRIEWLNKKFVYINIIGSDKIKFVLRSISR
ncbi:MAG: transcription-repair coupling factor [Candidatus Margulisiibacteriota bacterium]